MQYRCFPQGGRHPESQSVHEEGQSVCRRRGGGRDVAAHRRNRTCALNRRICNCGEVETEQIVKDSCWDGFGFAYSENVAPISLSLLRRIAILPTASMFWLWCNGGGVLEEYDAAEDPSHSGFKKGRYFVELLSVTRLALGKRRTRDMATHADWEAQPIQVGVGLREICSAAPMMGCFRIAGRGWSSRGDSEGWPRAPTSGYHPPRLAGRDLAHGRRAARARRNVARTPRWGVGRRG